MKKPILLALSLLFIAVIARSQDPGYSTFDVGVEYQWQPKTSVYDLHVAYNFPIHHSLQFRLGYTKSSWGTKGFNTFEDGGGPGGSVGYRYYLLYEPHGLFFGIRADVWRLTINYLHGTEPGVTKTWSLQTALESGYMIVINDQFFITPAVTIGQLSNVSTSGRPVGQGLMLFAGISTGWKF